MNDTHPDAERVQIELIRRMPPEKRAALASCCATAPTGWPAGRSTRPAELSEADRKLLFIEVHYGVDLAAASARSGPSGRSPMPDAADIQALWPVAQALKALGIEFHVGGSVASNVYGVWRSTMDTDLVAIAAKRARCAACGPAVERLLHRRFDDSRGHRPTRAFNVITRTRPRRSISSSRKLAV